MKHSIGVDDSLIACNIFWTNEIILRETRLHSLYAAEDLNLFYCSTRAWPGYRSIPHRLSSWGTRLFQCNDMYRPGLRSIPYRLTGFEKIIKVHSNIKKMKLGTMVWLRGANLLSCETLSWHRHRTIPCRLCVRKKCFVMSKWCIKPILAVRSNLHSWEGKMVWQKLCCRY